jgi:putative ABC transport system permease protein
LHGNDMRQDFIAALSDEASEGGKLAALRYALEAFVDILRTGIAERAAMIGQDLAFAFRTARKAPLFSSIVVATIALAIAANIAVYSVLSAVLLRPLPYAHPERVVFVWEKQLNSSRADLNKGPVSWPDAYDFREMSTTFVTTAAYNNGNATLLGLGAPRLLHGFATTAPIFDVLGAHAEIGRFFTLADEKQSTPQVVVISDKLWRSVFNASPSVIGRTVSLSDRPVTIIGVAPATFEQPDPGHGGLANADYWLVKKRATSTEQDRSSHSEREVALLKPHVSIAAANADLERIFAILVKKHGESNAGRTAFVTDAREELLGKIGPMLLTVYIAVLGVLLIACANVANLLLSRAASREGELSVRFALGASRRRIVAQLLTETLLYAIAGGGAGLALAAVAIEQFIALNPPGIPRLSTVSVDITVIAYSAGIVLVTTLIAGLIPALSLSKPDLSGSLKAGGRGIEGGYGARTRRLLVIAEIALALALVTLSGLSLRSFIALINQPMGVNIDRVYVVRLAGFSDKRYAKSPAVRLLQTRLMSAMSERFGSSSSSFALTYPFSGVWSTSEAEFPGRKRDALHPDLVDVGIVSPPFFDILHIPLLRGRAFDARDVYGATPVVIVTRSFAERYFPRGDALGHSIEVGFETNDDVKKPPFRKIVGIVADTRHDFTTGVTPEAFMPAAQEPLTWDELLVRSAAPQHKVENDVRKVVQSVDPTLPAPSVVKLSDVELRFVSRERVSAALLATLAFIALFLAIAGVYGVVSYGVAQRTHEIGIRVALGARTFNILSMVLRGALAVAVAGICIGLGLAAICSRLLTDQLFGVSTLDALTYVSVVTLLLVVVFIAALVPAVRASRIQPMSALRYE